MKMLRNVKGSHRDYSTLQQLAVGLAANLGSIASGMTLGYSAVALPAMQTEHDVSDEQASWIGECLQATHSLHLLLPHVTEFVVRYSKFMM
jgi:hypothetical protein